ncbi:hypothetical protein BSAF29S_01738 [Bacillus safensis subsp. safensis]
MNSKTPFNLQVHGIMGLNKLNRGIEITVKGMVEDEKYFEAALAVRKEMIKQLYSLSARWSSGWSCDAFGYVFSLEILATEDGTLNGFAASAEKLYRKLKDKRTTNMMRSIFFISSLFLIHFSIVFSAKTSLIHKRL